MFSLEVKIKEYQIKLAKDLSYPSTDFWSKYRIRIIFLWRFKPEALAIRLIFILFYFIYFFMCILIFLFIFLTSLLYWSVIALPCCVSFCCITKWISYMYTYIPISPPSCVSLPPSLSHPSRWSQSTELISLCYVAPSH